MLPNICEIKPNKVNSNMKSKYFFFYGEQGTWKTTVASKFPRSLLIGGEIGYQFIDGIYALPVNNWSDIKDLYRQLKSAQAKSTYDTIIFDTISNIYQMCYKYVLGQFGVNDPGEVPFGKGWRAIKDEFALIKEISKLGYGLVFIAHAKETEVTDAKTKETTIKVKSDLDTMPASVINALVDFTFYVRKEMEEDGTENVYAYCALPNIETKRRLDTFSPRILFTYENLIEELERAIEKKGVPVDNTNIREVNEVPWTTYRDEVIKLVQTLSTSAAAEEMTRYITEMFPNTRLSETSELHKDKLIAARDYLIGLGDKIA